MNLWTTFLKSFVIVIHKLHVRLSFLLFLVLYTNSCCLIIIKLVHYNNIILVHFVRPQEFTIGHTPNNKNINIINSYVYTIRVGLLWLIPSNVRKIDCPKSKHLCAAGVAGESNKNEYFFITSLLSIMWSLKKKNFALN